MTSLLLSTTTHCSECSNPLSGGRDTYGTFDCPLCLDCKFVCDERGWLPIDKEQVAEDIKELDELRETAEELAYHLIKAMQGGAAEGAIEVIGSALESTQEDIAEIETYYGLLPGEEIIR